MGSTIVVVCDLQGQTIDLQIPLDIKAVTLINVLSEKLRLPKMQDYIRCENPVAMLTGELTVADYRLHDGSILYL